MTQEIVNKRREEINSSSVNTSINLSKEHFKMPRFDKIMSEETIKLIKSDDVESYKDNVAPSPINNNATKYNMIPGQNHKIPLSIIYGPPLAGKSTFIEQHTGNFHHISVGKICREIAKGNTPDGAIIRKSIEQNTFFPSNFLLDLVLPNKNLDRYKENVLDGYPKYKHEVLPLIQFVEKKNLLLKNLYLINPPLNVLLDRLGQRLTCDPCYRPLRKGEVCFCGGVPFVREEDTEKYFKERYNRFIHHANDVVSDLSIYCKEVINVKNY